MYYHGMMDKTSAAMHEKGLRLAMLAREMLPVIGARRTLYGGRRKAALPGGRGHGLGGQHRA